MKLKRAEDMAKRLGIEKETLLGWRDLGMPWVKIGKSIFILEDSFLSWARDHEVKQENGEENENGETDRTRQASLSLVSKV